MNINETGLTKPDNTRILTSFYFGPIACRDEKSSGLSQRLLPFFFVLNSICPFRNINFML